MRLTIIVVDGAVYKDGVCYDHLVWAGTPPSVHALQWFGDNGWVEFADGAANETISQLPDWANNAVAAWGNANTPQPPAPPTADDNKNSAVSRLAATDWVNQPDVYDPSVNPHLANRDAFIAYRAAVRAVAVTPVAGNLDWPTEPTAVWSQA